MYDNIYMFVNIYYILVYIPGNRRAFISDFLSFQCISQGKETTNMAFQMFNCFFSLSQWILRFKLNFSY